MAERELDGLTLSYGVHGTGGEPMLLIPPAASRGSIWTRHQVPALVAAGYVVVVPELRHTTSVGLPKPFGLFDLVSDVAALITALGLGPCRVAGASLGALIAQELAVARSELVTALGLLGTRGRTDAYREALGRGHAQAMRDGSRNTALFEATSYMAQLFGPETLADDAFVGEWLTSYQLFRPGGAGAAAHYEATLGYDRLAELSSIRVPTLVISFGRDVIMPPAEGAAVARAIPRARFVELPGCGHFGFLERPGEVNELLIDFFDGVEREP
ncbi:alpha/beta fold hydrolase [Streptomyces sp. NPDC015125]|uniref:alpha/beta fold hydrolase n=1 Tax=Streptomyces sp. NPDC015125 TaxID=3364938 RepID=UPI0036FF3B07